MPWIGIRGFSELNFLVLKWGWLNQKPGDQVTRNGSTFKDFSRHHWTCVVAQLRLLCQIFCFRKLLRFDRNLQKNDYIQLFESKWKDSWKHGAFYDPCRSWKPLQIGRKGGKKRRKLCTPEILVTHLRRTKIGVVYYLHHQWVCFESAGLNLSSSVWSRGCTHAMTDIQQQSIKGGQFHTDFSTLQIEINKLLISMHNIVNILICRVERHVPAQVHDHKQTIDQHAYSTTKQFCRLTSSATVHTMLSTISTACYLFNCTLAIVGKQYTSLLSGNQSMRKHIWVVSFEFINEAKPIDNHPRSRV